MHKGDTAFPTRQLLDEPALHWSECHQDLVQNRRDENAAQCSDGKFSKHTAQNRAGENLSVYVSLAVATDSGEHDSSQIPFQ
jgi:hypothetical protein